MDNKIINGDRLLQKALETRFLDRENFDNALDGLLKPDLNLEFSTYERAMILAIIITPSNDFKIGKSIWSPKLENQDGNLTLPEVINPDKLHESIQGKTTDIRTQFFDMFRQIDYRLWDTGNVAKYMDVDYLITDLQTHPDQREGHDQVLNTMLLYHLMRLGKAEGITRLYTTGSDQI